MSVLHKALNRLKKKKKKSDKEKSIIFYKKNNIFKIFKTKLQVFILLGQLSNLRVKVMLFIFMAYILIVLRREFSFSNNFFGLHCFSTLLRTWKFMNRSIHKLLGENDIRWANCHLKLNFCFSHSLQRNQNSELAN